MDRADAEVSVTESGQAFFLAQVGRQLARGRSDRPKGVRSKGWGIISEIQMLVWTGSRIKGGEMLPCTGSEMTALLCH